MNRDELLALADRVEALAGRDRVEALAGPDRVIDELALLASGWTLERAKDLGERATWIDPSGKRTVHRQGDGWFRPTASLDAAMTLVPEGAFWSLCMKGEATGYSACCQERGDGGLLWTDAATPALALTAAALRAIAAQGGE